MSEGRLFSSQSVKMSIVLWNFVCSHQSLLHNLPIISGKFLVGFKISFANHGSRYRKILGKIRVHGRAAVPGVLGPATGVCHRVLSLSLSEICLRRSIFFEELDDLSTDTNDNYFGVYLFV